MASTLGWLDHDPHERERVTRILALFKEKNARDELGLGGIRDSIADQLFPGTSTIQTRLRYMLFVPWVYQRLEQDRVASADVACRARRLETKLIQPLLDENEAGVLGRLARGGLKRLPSAVYWAGLGSWGIRRFGGAQDTYHRTFDRLHTLRAKAPQKEGDESLSALTQTWDPTLPSPPVSFPESLSFELTHDEAEYLRDRIRVQHPRSLLAQLVAAPEPSAEVAHIWMHPRLGLFSAEHRELVHHARLFAEVMAGAAVVYNLELARTQERHELIREHDAELEQWLLRVTGSELRCGLEDWSLERFWQLVIDHGHTISLAVRRFVETWLQITRSGDRARVDGKDARALVRNRERSLKGSRSRFENARARDQWSGYSGLGLAAYRWPITRAFLVDLSNGLRGPEGA